MRRWLDPVERKEIERVLAPSFIPLGTYPFLKTFDSIFPNYTVEAPPEFDRTHDEHFGMAGFRKK